MTEKVLREETKEEETIDREAGQELTDLSLEELSKRVNILEQERDELKERLLRLQAEFDNYRKRTKREIDEFRERAHEAVICDILYVLDNVERALEAAEEGAGKEDLSEGLKLIQKQFKEILKRFGVEEVTSLYCKFDPNLHQAVLQVDEEREKEKDQTVIQEVEKGYLLKGRLLRPSKVVVCRYAPPQQDERKKEE